MEARQITIFGGSGFLGRHTVRALAKQGWRIKVATRHPNRAFFLLGHLGLDGTENPATLSGGEARRAALARALAPRDRKSVV